MTALSESPDWSRRRSIVGGAEFVPDAVARMVRAANAADASLAYWELDNRVVVQGRLFEAAAWTARAVAVAICRDTPSVFGLSRALDLLVEIAAGEADQSEIAEGNTGLGSQCRHELGQYLSCFHSFAASEDDRTLLAVMDLLDILEADRHELRTTAEFILSRGASAGVERRARELAEGERGESEDH